jgi:hypothetical protein
MVIGTPIAPRTDQSIYPPDPLNFTAIGFGVAPALILSIAVRCPVVLGENVTVIEHLDLLESVLLQVVVSLKSSGLKPSSEILTRLIGTPLLLVKVTVRCLAL